MELQPAILKGSNGRDDVVINTSPFDIGRNKSAKKILTDFSISRNHCKFLCDENQKWTLHDFSSSGTFVNNTLIGAGNSKDLEDGNEVRLGPVESNVIWKFYSTVSDRGEENLLPMAGDMGAQSQAIVDICTEKNKLERQMIFNKESHVKIKNEREILQKQCDEQLLAMELKYAKEREELRNSTAEMKQKAELRAKEEKERIQREANEKLKALQDKLNENDKIELELKNEIQKLQQKMEEEKKQWEASLLEEKRKLEEKLQEQEREFNCEKMKVELTAQKYEKELEDKLTKQEEEKEALMRRLKEMEAAQTLLSQKLKESDELHLLDKAKLEEDMQKEKIKQEERLREELEKLKKNKEDIEKNLKAELEKKESEKSQVLLKELEAVKAALIKTETSKEQLENKMLANITDVMESELQCSICAELFVTAITLNCTHTFCKYCITEWKKKKKNCPICRKKISSETRSIVMDNYIDKMVESFSKDLKERREAIIIERNGGAPPKKMKMDTDPSVPPPRAPAGPVPGTSNTNTARASSNTSSSSDDIQANRNRRPGPIPSSSTSAPLRANPIPTIDLTVPNNGRNVSVRVPAPMSTIRLQRLPAVRGPNQTQYIQLPMPLAPGARVMLRPLPVNMAQNNANAIQMQRAVIQTRATLNSTGQSSSSPSSERTEVDSSENDDDDDDDNDNDGSDQYDSDENMSSQYSDHSNNSDLSNNSYYNDEDSDRSVEGIPGVYYGGYGHCFRCGRRGHWANGCPNRYR